MFMPGNKSYINALNKGKSSLRNLGILESRMALIRTASSFKSYSALFNAPAITNTLLTARIPKS